MDSLICRRVSIDTSPLYDNYDMFDEALEEYQGVLGRDPDHLKALLNMGNLICTAR